ncbi:MAG TPA: energy transducer TonB [Burkholderiaceae bacterium]
MPHLSPLHPSLQRQDALSPATRHAVVAGVISLQAAAAWGLLQLDGVRHAVAEVIPVLLQQQLAPPASPAPSPPPPPRRVPPPKREPPVIAAPAPPVAVAPAPFEVPPAEPIPEPAPPPAPEPVVTAAPPPPAPAPPQPRAVDIHAVRYLVQPVLNYPLASRRLGEQGRVDVRVLVDANGMPQEMRIVRSSGFPRLDDSALATVRATRFKPYTENGSALAFWVVMPLAFELEN